MSRLPILVLALLSTACTQKGRPVAPDAAPPVKEQLTPRQVVDRAVAAHGGAEALRRGLSSYTMQTRGTFHGMPFSMTTVWQAPNRMVMRMPGLEMGYIGKDCWTRVRDVVSPCPPAEARAAQEIKVAAHVASLYPLVGKGVRLGAARPRGKAHASARAVKVSLRNLQAVLFFDSETDLLRGMRYVGTWNGERGVLESSITAYKKQGGVQLPARTVMTFRGKEVMVEELVEARLGETGGVTRGERPETVLGQVRFHDLPPHLAAYTVHRGSPDGIGKRTGELMAWMKGKHLTPLGPPVLVHVSAHPLRKAMETEIHVTTVGRPPGEDGEFGIKGVQASHVAIRVVRGDWNAQVRAMHELLAWARKHKHTITGPPMTITHGDPGPATPTEVCVPVARRR